MKINPQTIFSRGAIAKEYRNEIRKARLDVIRPICERINSGKSTLQEEAKREDVPVATLRQRIYAAGVTRQFVMPEGGGCSTSE